MSIGMEILGFSDDNCKKEFKKIIQEITQEVHQHLVVTNVKYLADQNKSWKVIQSMIV